MLENSQEPHGEQFHLAGHQVSATSALPCHVVWKQPEIIYKGGSMVVFQETFIYKTRWHAAFGRKPWLMTWNPKEVSQNLGGSRSYPNSISKRWLGHSAEPIANSLCFRVLFPFSTQLTPYICEEGFAQLACKMFLGPCLWSTWQHPNI